jgi:hypothetical protein
MSRWGQKSIAGAAIAALLCPAPGFAQTHRVVESKPEQVVRAVGVYEWTGDLSKPTGSRFVPISLFIDGEIEDAGVYLPRPVPFALLTGNVYELEDAGLSKGTLVLEQAMKASSPEGAPAPAFIDGWTAYGTYKAPPTERKAAPLRASKTLPVIQTSGGDSSRPHFSNKPAADTKTTTKTDDTQKPPDVAKSSDTADTGDSSRPTMKRRTDPPSTVNDETDPPKDPNSAASLPPKDSDDDKSERPTLKRRSMDEISQDQKAKKKEKESASVTAAGSMAGDPDRPRLSRKTKSDDDEEQPKLMGVPSGMRQMVAVSDAKTRAAHVFARPWESMDERSAVLVKMQSFARAKLAAYGVVHGIVSPQAIAATGGTVVGAPTTIAANTAVGPPTLKRGVPTDDTTDTASVKPAATPAPSASSDPAAPKLKRGVPTNNTTMTASASAARTASVTHTSTVAAKTVSGKPVAKTTPHSTSAKGKRATAKAPVMELAGEDLRGYVLSYGGSPTYVYTAHTVEEPDAITRYVTVVAQADAMGQLKVAIASATDAAHLDRTPWMRLVDAVDIEASNRASLLFEMRGQSSRQFALYRVIAAKPEQIFTTSM